MILDLIFAASSASILLLAIAHYYFGTKAYVEGSSMDIFRRDANWVPETSKEKALLGVFYITSFTWIQSQSLVLAMMLVSNPIGPWLGVITLATTVPQYMMIRKYIAWNRVAGITFLVNIIVNLLWFSQFGTEYL